MGSEMMGETDAADIAQIVETTVAKQEEKSPIEEVKTLPTPDDTYIDPIDEEYIIARKNQVGDCFHKDSEEGRTQFKRTLEIMGEQPLD